MVIRFQQFSVCFYDRGLGFGGSMYVFFGGGGNKGLGFGSSMFIPGLGVVSV